MRTLASVLLGLLSLAAPAMAQEQASTVGSTRTVRVRLSIRVPEMATVRSVTPAGLRVLPDGRRELTVAVAVGANCRWTLGVRRRAWWDRRALAPIEVLRSDGVWVALGLGDAAVPVIVNHEACNADTHEIRLRVQNAEAERVFERVEFVVAPAPAG